MVRGVPPEIQNTGADDMIAVCIVCNHCGVRAHGTLKHVHLFRKELRRIGWKHVEAKGIDLCEKCADICELDHAGIRCEVERVRKVFHDDMNLLQKACGLKGHKWNESDEHGIHCDVCGTEENQ